MAHGTARRVEPPCHPVILSEPFVVRDPARRRTAPRIGVGVLGMRGITGIHSAWRRRS